MPYQSAHDRVQMLSLNADGTAAQQAHYELLGDPTVAAAALAARFALQEAAASSATLSAVTAAHQQILTNIAADAIESTTATLTSQGAVLAVAAKGS